MRLRFTIRDLLWLTLVVAMGAGWWVHRQYTETRHISEFYVKWSDPYKDVEILRDVYRDRQDVEFVAWADSVTIITPSPSLREQLERFMGELDSKPAEPMTPEQMKEMLKSLFGEPPAGRDSSSGE